MVKSIKLVNLHTGTAFDKTQTNIVKGIAVLLLLWHHLFFNDPKNYDIFISLFNLRGIPVECFIASYCKVCVSIFLFLSGYGLYKSYSSYLIKLEKSKKKASVKTDLIYIKNHLIKLLSDYWFIYIVFVSMGFIFGRNPIDIYQGNILYFVIDFFGIANIFNTPTMNGTWWFMSLIIMIYIIYPFIHRMMKWSSEVVLLGSYALLVLYFIPNISNFRIYLFAFILGAYFSQRDIFVLIKNKINTFVKVILSCILALFITFWLKTLVFMNGAEIDSFLALAIILSVYLFISRIPVVNFILEKYGKYSGLIFMFHTFIYSYYFRDFIFSFKYSLLIYLALVVICFVVAIVLKFAQRLLRYDRLIAKMIKQK